MPGIDILLSVVILPLIVSNIWVMCLFNSDMTTDILYFLFYVNGFQSFKIFCHFIDLAVLQP